MSSGNGQLHDDLKVLQQKYETLEKRYKDETALLKKNEEELRLRLMFLEGIANSTFDGFLVLNPYGQKILQNQRAIDLWKIPKEVVDDPSGLKQVNHVMHVTLNPKQFVAEIDYLREHPDEKSCDEVELVDGTVLDRYSSPVIGPDGINYGRIWTFHDITERKKVEKQLIRLNTDKNRFISILSHDLRSPFTCLLGFSELLREELRDYPKQEVKEMVNTICHTVQKTYDLLQDTLLWANVMSKNLTFNPSLVNVSEVICEVANILEPSANVKSICIEYNSGKELMVYADAYMLKAVLRNLVSNAIKFTKKGGKIQISAIHDKDITILKVADNGVGMKPDILDKLFNIASLQSSEGTDNETGTGLGLLLCKEFVDKHNGKIWVNSIVDEGTEISFSLPYRKNN
jgi:signal transduction histidine kinase